MSELLKQASVAPIRRLVTDSLPKVAAIAPDVSQDTKASLAAAFAEELAELKEEARSDGYLAGYESGASDAAAHFAEKVRELTAEHKAKQAELDAQVKALAALHDVLQTDHQRALMALEPQAAAIAYASVCQIAGEGASLEALLNAAVQHAVQSFASASSTTISLAEQDAELFLSKSELASWHSQIRADKRLARGSCIIEAGPRSLDASLLTQLDQLRHVLTKTAEA